MENQATMESTVGITANLPQEKEDIRVRLANDIVNKEREVQEENLVTDKNWSDAYRIVHELVNEGEPYGGEDEDAARDGLRFMSEVNYNLSLGTIPFAAKVSSADMSDEQKIAVRYMMDTYDKKDISMDGFGRFAKEVGLDPTTYVGVGTLGWGMAGKQVAKEAAKRTLMEATKLNVKKFATGAYGAAAFEGAAYTAADDAAFQKIKMATGEQEGYRPGQTAISAGIGAVVAPVAMKGLMVGGEQVVKGGRFLRDAMREFRDAQPFSYAPNGTPLWDNPGGGIPPQATPQFYSQLSNALTETNQKTWNKEQLKGFLAKQGVKTEEMKWSGIEEYLNELDGRAKVTTQELLEELNPPQLEKTILKTDIDDVEPIEVGLDEVTKEHFGFNDWVMEDAVRAYDYENVPGQKIVETKDGKFYALMDGEIDEHTSLDDAIDRLEEANAGMDWEGKGEGYTKYEDYKTNKIGGTNYREELTTLKDTKLPEGVEVKKEDMGYMVYKNGEATGFYEETYEKAINNIQFEGDQYKSSHWDESNVLYHVRKQDVVIETDIPNKIPNRSEIIVEETGSTNPAYKYKAKGGTAQPTKNEAIDSAIEIAKESLPEKQKDNTLLIEEIQSDWHQEGRKKGYSEKANATEEEIKRHKELVDNSLDFTREFPPSEAQEMYDLEAKMKGKNGVPQAPYSKTWHEKAMKDQIAEAVEKDYDRVAWVAGKEQAERYDLSKSLKSLGVVKRQSGEYELQMNMPNGTSQTEYVKADGLEDAIGKEMAEKIIKDTKKKENKFYDNVDLKVGGEGMKGFYDKILPKWTNKYIKKFDSKVEVKELSNGQEVWSFEVTDKMKEAIKGKGQALYSSAAGVGIAASQGEDNGNN